MTLPLGQSRTLSRGEDAIYTVGQCARILNVSTKTLRHYDAVGLFGPAKVGEDNQYRYYSRDQLPVLRRIVFLRDLGLGVEVIRELLHAGALDDPARVQTILEEHAAVLRREMEVQRERLTRVERALTRGATAPIAVTRPVLIKRVPEVRAVGVRRAIPVREMDALVREAARRLGGPPTGPRVNVYYNPEFDPEFVDVEVLFPVAEGGDRALPTATVATVLLIGLEDSAGIGAAYATVYDWIEEHGTQDTGPPREVLLVGPGSGKRLDEQVLEIQVPIDSAD